VSVCGGDTAGVDVMAEMSAPCPPEELFAWVDDLSRYPTWLGIIERAEPVTSSTPEPAWSVDLRGRVGPFARSKRLRMVRTDLQVPSHVVFERRETDDRHHSHWRLEAAVGPTSTGSTLSMELHYGGSLWGPVLERLLAEEIERSRERLLTLVSAPRR
jgi:hypothetical protein